MVNTIDQQLAVVRTYYLSGEGGQHPHIIESVVAAIDFAYTSAVAECPEGHVTLGPLRRTLTAAADSASANAAIYDALVCTGSGVDVLPLEYLAAWAAHTAKELRAVVRAIETECAADPPADGTEGLRPARHLPSMRCDGVRYDRAMGNPRALSDPDAAVDHAVAVTQVAGGSVDPAVEAVMRREARGDATAADVRAAIYAAADRLHPQP